MAETIGDWSPTQLVRFIQDMLRQNPPEFAPNLTAEELVVASKLTCSDLVIFTQRQNTVGSAGGASALPATPLGYFRVSDYTGAIVVVPYYKSS